ncbi:hypothetical protein T492DRAFT_155292 [Pavlovales sp. CCMP2436]|nr:hypothetical protein T492DRAFT_155292 [Pavlovales sp. CCMP2436]
MDESAAEAVCHACMGPPAEGATLRRCSGCQFAHYCSEAHQKLAWAQMGHAAECKLIATAKPRTPTRSMRLAAIAAHVSLKHLVWGVGAWRLYSDGRGETSI